MSTPLVLMSGVAKVYQTEDLETRALWNIDLAVETGEFMAVTGPSGCGKSTLLSIIGLMDLPSHGSILIGGHDVSSLSLTQRARLRNQMIGFIFQSFHLVGDLNALDNVALPLMYAGAEFEERRGIAATALKRVGMQQRMRHYPSQLSGGQQQRVAIARAIAARPKLVLADEPTGNLDSDNGRAVMQLLSEIHEEQNTTICLVTHDSAHCSFANRIVQLLDGGIISDEVKIP